MRRLLRELSSQMAFLCEQCSITIIAFSGKSEYEMIPEK